MGNRPSKVKALPSLTRAEETAILRKEIKQLIAPHQEGDNAPPFSPAELLVMAISCRRPSSTTKNQALHWIIKMFKFYNDKAVKAYVFNPRGSNCVIEGFEGAFREYAVPFVMVDQSRPLRMEHGAARIFLAKHLQPERRGTFNFLGLPLEMRNMIYELVLQLPESGIMLDLRSKHAFALEAEGGSSPNQQLDLKTWNYHIVPRYARYKVDIPKVLRLLLVCKQISQEATSIFYHTNKFYIHGVENFYKIHQSLSSTRFQNIRNVRLEFKPVNYSHWMSVTEMLATTKLPFKILILNMEDGSWDSLPPRHRDALLDKKRVKTFKGIEETPGFHNLAIAASRAEIFEIRPAWRSCDKIKAFLEKQVALIKSEEVAAEIEKRPVKRKRKSRAKTAGAAS